MCPCGPTWARFQLSWWSVLLTWLTSQYHAIQCRASICSWPSDSVKRRTLYQTVNCNWHAAVARGHADVAGGIDNVQWWMLYQLVQLACCCGQRFWIWAYNVLVGLGRVGGAWTSCCDTLLVTRGPTYCVLLMEQAGTV